MKSILIIGYLMLSWFFAAGQLPGKYNSRNETNHDDAYFEELVLNTDNTFNYLSRSKAQAELTLKGKWSVNADTLILNEDNPDRLKSITVEERSSKSIKKGSVMITVTHFDNSQPNFEVTASHGDTTMVLKNQYISALVKLFPIQRFYIDGPACRYPVHEVKSDKSNVFRVMISPRKLFINEKWLVVKGNIRPKDPRGGYAFYLLKKQ